VIAGGPEPPLPLPPVRASPATGWRLDIANTEEHAILIEALVEHKAEEAELIELFEARPVNI